MENVSPLHRQPWLTSLTPSSSAEGSELQKEDSEIQKETPRASHENNRQVEQCSPKTEAVPWEEDPANAHNWSKPSRYFHSIVPSGVAFLAALGSSLYTPAVRTVKEEFDVSEVIAIMPFSFYVLGLAFGPLIGSPLSETWGRRRVYQISLPLFALFILGSGFAKSIGTLIICRFFAGFWGAPALSIGSATISDVWPPAQRAIPMAAYVAAPFMGPALGPLIGGFVVESLGWRWTQWVTLFFTAVFLPPVYFMKETYKKCILENRAEKNATEKLPTSKTEVLNAVKKFIRTGLTRPIHMLLSEPIAGLFSLYIAFNFALQYSFFVVFPTIFEEVYGFNLGSQGLIFLGLGAGIVIAIIFVMINSQFVYAPLAARWRKRHPNTHGESKTKSAASTPPPEYRLFTAFPGSMLIPIGLFLFAWTARPSVPWIVPVIGEALFGIGQVLDFMSCTMYLMDTYGPLYGASAMAANTLLRYTLGFAFPLFVNQMYKKLGIDWATSLLGFISVALTLVPWCFWIWGPKLRAMNVAIAKVRDEAVQHTLNRSLLVPLNMTRLDFTWEEANAWREFRYRPRFRREFLVDHPYDDDDGPAHRRPFYKRDEENIPQCKCKPPSQQRQLQDEPGFTTSHWPRTVESK
ncbi:hypothetical protein Vi05172_g12982 [Venturia inaequalis]|nr:hypothetical protein Vi05172_g12982 [Venturia inaequalis]